MTQMMRSQMGGSNGFGGNSFPNPWLDVASMSMPQSLRNALYWMEYLYLQQGTYRAAQERIAAYFLTDIEINGKEVGDDEKDKWKTFLIDTIGYRTVLFNSLCNTACYGNDFTSVIVPFKRFLCCPKCGSTYPLKEVFKHKVFNFAWDNMHFVATCPVCKVGSGFRGQWKIDDKSEDEERKIRVKHWSPHEIEILHDYYTDEVAYLWRIPEDYKAQVRRGHLFHLERASVPLLEAIRNNEQYRFNPDVLFHMKEPTLAGVRNRGWGIPKMLSNFRQIYYVQVLRRYNEAIALDYVMPFRLLTPMPRGGGSGAGGGQAQDPLLTFGGGDFRAQCNAMLRRRRKDPCTWNVLPFAVNAQFIGGDASKLAPRELIDQGNEELLNAAGVPVDLYKGSLQIQAAPPALRLFESMNANTVHNANNWLNWFARQISQIMSWEIVDPKLQRVTMADDMSKVMAALQLMTGSVISKTTGLASVGLQYKDEVKRMGEEAEFEAEQQSQVQEEMQQQSFAQQIAKGQAGPPGQGGGGQGGGGGDPSQGGGQGGGGGGDPSQGGGQPGGPGQGPGQGPVDQYLAGMSDQTPVTPQMQTQAAQDIAQQLMGQPDAAKNQQLRTLKQRSEVMHALVTKAITNIRQQARSQGGAAMISQQFGGGQGGGGQGGGQ